MDDHTRHQALLALCRFWELLEETAPVAGYKTGTHMLDALRRTPDDVKHGALLGRAVHDAYILARFTAEQAGIEIEDAPMTLRASLNYERAGSGHRPERPQP